MDHNLTPVGALLEEARKKKVPSLSIRKAAEAAGFSEGWWRQIARGYRPLKGGGREEVDAPDQTLAKMAFVVDVTPKQLTELGREGAAAHLQVLLDRAPAKSAEAIADVPDDVLLDELRRRLFERAEMLDGGPLPALHLVARQVPKLDTTTFAPPEE